LDWDAGPIVGHRAAARTAATHPLRRLNQFDAEQNTATGNNRLSRQG
jgi:hypothetical protein